ncbi:unnamed protein product [Brassica napus]|uniref:(rape) hypothetical protein n=1 Tax=Brassica napus TaxID=3708 RepID=A0A816WEM1_BRANA|nr:unnamed protein product [Brassica napus]
MPKKKPKKPSPTQFAKSSSVILPVEAEVNGTSDAAGSSKKLATADARDDSLGSQLAIPKVILPVQNEQRTNERCREKEKNCKAVHARLRRRTFARRL